MIVSANPDALAWLEKLLSYKYFVELVQLSERLLEQRFDLELVLRFLFLHNRSEADLTQSSLRDLTQKLDDFAIEFASSFPKDRDVLGRTFRKTFKHLSKEGGEQLFRRWDEPTNSFKGSFLTTAFELIALGVGFHIANGRKPHTDLLTVVKSMWGLRELQRGFATGKSTEARLARFVPLGRSLTASSPRAPIKFSQQRIDNRWWS